MAIALRRSRGGADTESRPSRRTQPCLRAGIHCGSGSGMHFHHGHCGAPNGLGIGDIREVAGTAPSYSVGAARGGGLRSARGSGRGRDIDPRPAVRRPGVVAPAMRRTVRPPLSRTGLLNARGSSALVMVRSRAVRGPEARVCPETRHTSLGAAGPRVTAPS